MKVMGFLAPTTTGFTMSLTTVAKRGCLPAHTNTQVVSNRTSRRNWNGPLAFLQVAQTSGMVSLSFFDRLFHLLYAGDEFCRTFSVLFPDSRSRESQNNHRFLAPRTSTLHSIVVPSTSPVPLWPKCGMPLCVSFLPAPVVLMFLIVLPSSLSNSLTAASKLASSGTQKTIERLSSGVETVMTSPSGSAFHPFGSSNVTPAS